VSNVEVDRKEPARLVVEQRVNAHHVPAGQVPDDGSVVAADEGLVRGIAALDPVLQPVDPVDEFVRTRGRVTGAPRFLANEPRREDVLADYRRSRTGAMRLPMTPR
jgi:hypothetical protein